MDWARGRPPDALLYLKALIKATPLPLPPPLTLPTPTPLTAVAAADVTAAAAPDDCRRGAHAALTHVTEAVAAAIAAPAAADKEVIEVPVVAVANVPVPRMLAEGALLGPLGDVGTIAGALRRKIGGNLREMAAARCVRS